MSADVVFADTHVRLFFIRRSKRGPWSGLLTTDLSLGFFEAYRIYSRRWSQEVIFKESKGLLGLGKCQSANFAAQIASTSLVAIQYNILSAVKRFTDYETIGELFRQVNLDSQELTISERICRRFSNWWLPSPKYSSLLMKKSWMPWLMNLMSLLIFANYINVKWRVRNSRNLN